MASGTSPPNSTSLAEETTPTSGGKSWSMAMVVYGVKRKFPSVGNVTCEEVHVMREDPKTLILVLPHLCTARAHHVGVSSVVL